MEPEIFRRQPEQQQQQEQFILGPVCAETKPSFPDFSEVAQAYFDCRRNKRNSLYALDFEFELEKNLFDLYLDLTSGSYEPGRSIAFVIEQPKIREIWAATFRDRVVHHVIYNRLAPRFYLDRPGVLLPLTMLMIS